MIFTKDIKIKANDLKGPPGMKEIYVVLGFDQDAITTHNSEFDGAAWQALGFHIGTLGNQSYNLKYTANFGVCKTIVEGDKVVTAGIVTPITFGQQIDLRVDEIIDTPITSTFGHQIDLRVDEIIDTPITVRQQIDLRVDEIIDTPITIDLRAEKLIDMPISIGQQVDLVNDKNPRFDNLTPFLDEDGFAINNKITDRTVTLGAGLYDEKKKFSPITVWQGVWNGMTVDILFTPIISIFASPNFEKGKLLPKQISSLLWNHNLADENLPKSLVFNLAWNAKLTKFVLTME